MSHQLQSVTPTESPFFTPMYYHQSKADALMTFTPSEAYQPAGWAFALPLCASLLYALDWQPKLSSSAQNLMHFEVSDQRAWVELQRAPPTSMRFPTFPLESCCANRLPGKPDHPSLRPDGRALRQPSSRRPPWRTRGSVCVPNPKERRPTSSRTRRNGCSAIHSELPVPKERSLRDSQRTPEPEGTVVL
jgi:hypothetical protein